MTCAPDGTPAGERNCAMEGLVCAPAIGCTTCLPGRGGCNGNQTQICNDTGTDWIPGEICDDAAGLSCNPGSGVCSSLCLDAETSNSYIGCEYFPTPVSNSNVPTEFEFAVVIANPQVVPASITITRGGTSVATATVMPNALETIRLPWVPALKNRVNMEVSALVPNGAFRLRSNVPVTVYQFNALDYRIPMDCADEPILAPPDSQCFSFSNDASLLLPRHVLTGNYMVMSRPSMVNEITDPLRGPQYLSSPGFFAVVGAEETPVTVSVQFGARVEASVDGSVRAFNRGDNGMFTLNQGDVLQIVTQTPDSCPRGSPSETIDGTPITYCTMGDEYDLTGTEIRASGKVSVISGHNCAFVPHNRWACDHLEEAMFPLEAWGRDYVVSSSQPLRGEPNIVRVVSGHDGNAISFEPASVSSATTLDRGQMVEFETSSDVRVMGSEALMVGQFLVGQDYGGSGTSGAMGAGDPALSLGIPVEQFRSTYTFLAPSTYDQSYVNVTAMLGQDVFLDSAPVTGWTSVGGSGWQTARVMISGGQHTIEGGVGFGIVVYGFGTYTSYMYPGGLDFEEINIPF